MSLQLEQSPTTGDEVISNYTINFGPQHPAAHGVLRMVMELDEPDATTGKPQRNVTTGTANQLEYQDKARTAILRDRVQAVVRAHELGLVGRAGPPAS